MTETINVVWLRQPGAIDDPLTESLRAGARHSWPRPSVGGEAFLAQRRALKLPDGRERLVRREHGPERTIQTAPPDQLVTQNPPWLLKVCLLSCYSRMELSWIDSKSAARIGRAHHPHLPISNTCSCGARLGLG